jgi:hypothetical protein
MERKDTMPDILRRDERYYNKTAMNASTKEGLQTTAKRGYEAWVEACGESLKCAIKKEKVAKKCYITKETWKIYWRAKPPPLRGRCDEPDRLANCSSRP